MSSDDDDARDKDDPWRGSNYFPDRATEATGRATDDERLEAEGRADQSEADIKQAGEKVREAFSDRDTAHRESLDDEDDTDEAGKSESKSKAKAKAKAKSKSKAKAKDA